MTSVVKVFDPDKPEPTEKKFDVPEIDWYKVKPGDRFLLDWEEKISCGCGFHYNGLHDKEEVAFNSIQDRGYEVYAQFDFIDSDCGTISQIFELRYFGYTWGVSKVV